MRSKIEIELKANGALEEITQGEDKIFQGAVGVTEYHLSIADGITGDYNWRPTDIVYMSLKRNDGQTAQVKMTAENGGWVWTSNGWETDVDIVGTGDLELSFIGKRYSLVSVGTVVSEKTTEKIDLIVYESAGYVPQNIDIEIAEELQESINVLQLDKVGRYSVSEENLPYLPAEIIFDLDGAKTPNNVYFDFTNNVIDYDGETREKIGAVLVILNDGVQTELFLTSDGKMYSRTIDSEVTDFVSTAKVDFEFYTYNKVEIDQKDADTLQSAKDYADENFYNETDADERFMHLSGNETIADTKTFSASPIVPTPSANTHAVNRKYVTDNFYDKGQIGNLTSPISFATEQQFFDWLAGEYVRPDGILPQDLLLGKKVIIQETGKNNYQVAQVPALSIECYKILVEDNKYASEIGFVPYKEIIATDTQEAVEQVKDEVDLKTQTTEEADLTILTTDWVLSGADYYYDYFNANYTNQTKQRLEFISNDLTQNTTLETEQFTVRAIQTITVGETIGVRIYANLVPSIDLTFKVMLQTYTDSIIEAGIIQASAVVYDNTSSGLTATNVKAAIDELKGITDDKVDKSAIKQTTGTSETDLMSQNAITSELNSKVNQSDFNALKSKLIYEDSSITFAKQMLDKANLYLYVSGVKSNVLTLLSNSNYNINFMLSYSYTDIDGSTTKTVSRTINTTVNCHFGINLEGGFNKIIELNDSGPGGALRRTLIQVNGEFSTGSSTKNFQISSMYIRIVDSMGNSSVSDLDTLNFVLTGITGIRVVEMPYENIGE